MDSNRAVLRIEGSCFVADCPSKRVSGSGAVNELHLFNFPDKTKFPLVRHQWALFSARDDGSGGLLEPGVQRICCKHFRETDLVKYSTNKRKDKRKPLTYWRLLDDKVCPSLFPPVKSHPSVISVRVTRLASQVQNQPRDPATTSSAAASIVRSHGGSDTNPTCYSFRWCWRQLLKHHVYKLGKRGNCSFEPGDMGVKPLVVPEVRYEDVDCRESMKDGTNVDVELDVSDTFIPYGEKLPPTQRHVVYKHAGQCLRFLRKKKKAKRSRFSYLQDTFLVSPEAAPSDGCFLKAINTRNLSFVKPEVADYFYDVELTFQHLKSKLPEDKVVQAYHLNKVIEAVLRFRILDIRRRECVIAVGGEVAMDDSVNVLSMATRAYLRMRWKHHLDRALQRELVPVTEKKSDSKSN